MTATRIYRVTGPDRNVLIRAQSKAQAIRYVAELTMTADVATQDELVELSKAGVDVQDASVPPP